MFMILMVIITKIWYQFQKEIQENCVGGKMMALEISPNIQSGKILMVHVQ